jgi:hypothetical protein
MDGVPADASDRSEIIVLHEGILPMLEQRIVVP